MKDQFAQVVLEALRRRKTPSDFAQAATTFYNLWFKDRGTSYFILFKKNLRITNLQFAEIVSLLRCHIFSRNSDQPNDPPLVSADEIKSFLQQLFADTLKIKQQYTIKDIAALTQQYEVFARRIVVLNPYHGSCTVYLPPGLHLRLDRVCAEAGYVHSAGRLVYVRNMTKATEQELTSSIQEHLAKYPAKTGIPALFRIYSHEDFTKWDRSVGVDDSAHDQLANLTYADDLSHGLDDVKIHTRKAYFNNKNIIEVARSLKSHFKAEQLVIPEPGNYKRSIGTFKEKYGTTPTTTLFLVTDSAIAPGTMQPLPKKYYVCYNQMWFNGNPLATFDEDKPAWMSHTTIPHSLAAAMINITRPWRKSKLQLIDPFGGSGTMLLESLKHKQIVAISSDMSPVANIVAKDNVRFFQMTTDELRRLQRSLIRYANPVTLASALGTTSKDSAGAHSEFTEAKRALDTALRKSKDPLNIAAGSAFIIQGLSFGQRLLFYVLLRTRMRHVAELAEEREEWPAAFRKELFNLIIRINSHICFLEFSGGGRTTENDTPYAIGDYSRVCWLNLDHSRAAPLHLFLKVMDARRITKNGYDLIVTDPPYGFNTKEEDLALIRLYKEFIWRAVEALRDDGQLVICCPHYSHSGRHMPVFIRAEFLTQQVLLAARDCGKRVRSEQFSLPAELHGLRPPYYWDAPTALRRSILHFHFQNAEGRNPGKRMRA